MWGKLANPGLSQNAENARDAGLNAQICKERLREKSFASAPTPTALGISYTE